MAGGTVDFGSAAGAATATVGAGAGMLGALGSDAAASVLSLDFFSTADRDGRGTGTIVSLDFCAEAGGCAGPEFLEPEYDHRFFASAVSTTSPDVTKAMKLTTETCFAKVRIASRRTIIVPHTSSLKLASGRKGRTFK